MASKTSRAYESAVNLVKNQGFTNFVSKLAKDTDADLRSMEGWIERLRLAYNRRYQQQQGKRVNFPWPGASNFEYPGSDIEIDSAKPAIMNIHFGGRRLFDMLPLNAGAMDQASSAGIALDYLFRYRMGERGVPDYFKQTNYSVESFLQHGLSVDKVFYSYLTETRREQYTWDTLPDALQTIQVVDDIDEEQQQVFAQMGVLAIPRDQWGEFAEQIEQQVVRAFDLDLQERSDRTAASEMMAFIKANNREQEVTIRRHAVIEDGPRVMNCDLESIVVPQGTRTLASASRIRHDMWFTEEDVRLRVANGMWAADAAEQVIDAGENRRTQRSESPVGARLYDAMRTRTGTVNANEGDDAVFKISEVYCYKLNAQKVPVPVVVTMDTKSKAVLRATEYNYAHGEWPFVESSFELNEQHYFSSRGIPGKIKPVERHLTAMMRAELNGLQMGTSQSFTYKMKSGINPQKLRWMPHLMIPVQNHDDLQPIQTNMSALALERPIFVLQGLISRLSGGRSHSEVAQMRQDRPETATATSQKSMDRAATLGLRGMSFQEGRKRIAHQVWALWRQFGPDEFYAMAAGEPMRKMTQHQIRGDFTIVPRGAVADMDPELRSQQAFTILDTLMKIEPLVSKDPRYEVDLVGAAKEAVDRLDETASQRFLRKLSPEESQQKVEALQAEAQRLAALREEAQRLQQGAAVTPEGQAALLQAIKSESPHKGLQPIITAADQAEDDARQAAALAGDAPA